MIKRINWHQKYGVWILEERNRKNQCWRSADWKTKSRIYLSLYILIFYNTNTFIWKRSCIRFIHNLLQLGTTNRYLTSIQGPTQFKLCQITKKELYKFAGMQESAGCPPEDIVLGFSMRNQFLQSTLPIRQRNGINIYKMGKLERSGGVLCSHA